MLTLGVARLDYGNRLSRIHNSDHEAKQLALLVSANLQRQHTHSGAIDL